MIEITYTHIYMLTPTPGVTQIMPSIHQKNKNCKVQEVSLLVILQKERGVIKKKKKYMIKKHRKNVVQSKGIKKRKKA
jgi:hypothetical protein